MAYTTTNIYETAACPTCKNEFQREQRIGASMRVHCQPKCRPGRDPKYDCVCEWCGDYFVGKWAGRFCSFSCVTKYKNDLTYGRDSGHVISEIGHGHRNRAMYYGVAHEAINRTAVFDRDGWVCGLCHKPVDKSLRWPDPFSASLDHVVPLSKGGPDLYSNVQCAHLRCNISKGARTDAGTAPDAERAEAKAR